MHRETEQRAYRLGWLRATYPNGWDEQDDVTSGDAEFDDQMNDDLDSDDYPCPQPDVGIELQDIRQVITDAQWESLYVALHRLKSEPTMDELALVMPEVVAILCQSDDRVKALDLRARAVEIAQAEARELGYMDWDVAALAEPDGDDLLTIQSVERALRQTLAPVHTPDTAQGGGEGR